MRKNFKFFISGVFRDWLYRVYVSLDNLLDLHKPKKDPNGGTKLSGGLINTLKRSSTKVINPQGPFMEPDRGWLSDWVSKLEKTDIETIVKEANKCENKEKFKSQIPHGVLYSDEYKSNYQGRLEELMPKSSVNK